MAEARRSESAPKGWPAALVMFHLGMWRERLRNSLRDMAAGRSDYTRPPVDVDEFNDLELPAGIGTPLADAAARSDLLLGELIELYAKVGERPIDWNQSRTTTEAVLRNSYTHPRTHMFAYHVENGAPEKGRDLFEEAATEMRAIDAPPLILGAALYNLAVVRAGEERDDEALALLREAFVMRPDLKAPAAQDPGLGRLHADPAFQELVRA